MNNVALVVLDTLRFDAFEQEFDWLPGRTFTNAWSTGRWTVPAHGSLFCGKYPSELGVDSRNEMLNCEERTLAEVLGEQGYTTRAFSCNPFISPSFDFDRGFVEFRGNWRIRHHDSDLFDWPGFLSEATDSGVSRYVSAIWGCIRGDCATIPSLRYGATLKLRDLGFIKDDDGAAEMKSYVEDVEFGEDEFLFLNLMEAHSPYNPPEEYGSFEHVYPPQMVDILQDEVEPVEEYRRAYDASVSYLSDVYEEIFEELKSDFEYIITLSDHGELFGEHGMWEHGHGVYPELTRVPINIYDGSDEHIEDDTTVSVLDVHSTVLDIAGASGGVGGSLLQSGGPGGGERLTETTGLNRRMKRRLLETEISEETVRSYDSVLRGIATAEGYGYETVDGFRHTGDTEPIELQNRLDEASNNLSVREVEESKGVSDRVEEQLKDLGYA